MLAPRGRSRFQVRDIFPSVLSLLPKIFCCSFFLRKTDRKMTGILHYCARTVSRNITKAAKPSFGRGPLESEGSRARAYHRNAVGTAANATYTASVRKFFRKSEHRPLLLICRNIQTTSVLGDAKDVIVPAFADSVSEGDVKWEKKAGDSVVEDETVCEIETDKTSITIAAPGKGVIEELYVHDGATVKPGMKLFRIKLGA